MSRKPHLHFPALPLLLITLALLTGCREHVDPERSSDPESAESAINGVYVGRLGIYRQFVVVTLGEERGAVHGTYFYARHGRDLDLSGVWDAETGEGHLTESWAGETTGQFRFTLTDVGLKGRWTAPDGSGGSDFLLQRFSAREAEPDPLVYARGGFYAYPHQSWFWGRDEEGETVQETFDTRSWVRIRPLSNRAFAFYLFVVGANGHQGGVDGVALWTDAETAWHFQDDQYIPASGPCKLRFAFEHEQVTVVPVQDCDHFGGARIGIPGGTYTRSTE